MYTWSRGETNMLGLSDLVYFWVIPNPCLWASFGNVSKVAP